MKAKILMGSLLLASTTLFSSCSDFLQEDPKGQLISGSYFKTQDELNMALVTLTKKAQGTQSFTNMLYPQWQGDDITANPGANKQACAAMDSFSATDDNKGVNDAWNRNFTLIKAANYIIKNASKTPTSETEINIALGQAKFWRAYAFFYLVRIFGPLPLCLDDTNDNYTMTLTNVDGIYAQIVEDLKEAEKLLPATYKEQGEPRYMFNVNVFVTQQAVKSTLSAVYMAMAGYPLNKGTEYYKLAAAKAKEVLDGVNDGTYDHALESEFKNVYSMANNYNKETILGINSSPFQDWGQDSQFPLCQLFESLGGWGDAWGELRFWKKYPAGPRKDAIYNKKIRIEGKTAADFKLVDFWEKRADGTAYIPEQHPMFCIFTLNSDDAGHTILNQTFDYTKPYNTTRMTNDHRHRLIRLSEVMLWYAEASARAGETTDLAKKCLKDVRARAVDVAEADKVDGISIDAMNADQLAKAAYEEHGWEVAGYWLSMVTRRADQLRMNTLKDTFAERVADEAVEVANGVFLKEGVKFTKTTWSDDYIYLPYPSKDASQNPNLKH